MVRKMIAFPWYGGKYSKLNWLLPLLPKCHHYVEPFGGSAAVLLNREPSPIETYNDLDGEVVNFFRVLREQPEELRRLLDLTPFSRSEYRQAVRENVTLFTEAERARRFYVRAQQSFACCAQANKPEAWGRSTTTVGRGISSRVSRWLSGIEGLDRVVTRLLTVQLENRTALDVVRLYDSHDTFFYCDPPYVHSARSGGSKDVYGGEMDDSDHVALAQTLLSAKGSVAVSGYDSPLYVDLFKGWNRFEHQCIARSSRKKGGVCPARTEVLWTNYDTAQEVAA